MSLHALSARLTFSLSTSELNPFSVCLYLSVSMYELVSSLNVYLAVFWSEIECAPVCCSPEFGSGVMGLVMKMEQNSYCYSFGIFFIFNHKLVQWYFF